MPCSEPADFMGASGNIYHFRALPFDAEFPEIRAIYFFTRMTENKGFPLILDETCNLHSAIAAHKHLQWAMIRGCNRVAFLDTTKLSHSQILDDLVEAFQGQCICLANK